MAFSPSKILCNEKRTRQLAFKRMDDIAELSTDSKEDVFVEMGANCVDIQRLGHDRRRLQLLLHAQSVRWYCTEVEKSERADTGDCSFGF